MNAAEQFARDRATLIPPKSRPVLVVRRRACGHHLADVHKVDNTLRMVGRRRNLVETGGPRDVSMVPFLVADIEHPAQPEAYGCKDSSGQLFDLAGIAAAARSATRLGEPYWI